MKSSTKSQIVAGQIRRFYQPQRLIGWTVVGSYKGFEVIKEV